jgi:ParB family transcriptional regulator, chromosome partitioning protein
MEQKTATIDKLAVDPMNVRKRNNTDTLASLKASILAHGISQPLAVRATSDGTYGVIAGARRLRAVRELIEEDLLSPDTMVPIVVRDVDDQEAREISLAENIIRHAMRPVDDFRAFKEMADEGLSVADIALRFGQSDRFVRGRLALGNLHPDILEALDRNELSFEAATAYTLNPDTDAQAKLFNEGPDYSSRNAYTIRQIMAGEGTKASSPRAKFIGEERYRAAGGEIIEDLFGEESVWKSTELLPKLVDDAFADLREKLLADGWSFVETLEEFGAKWTYEVPRIQPDGGKLTEAEEQRAAEIADILNENEDLTEADVRNLEEELDELEGRQPVFTAEQKAKAGVIIEMDRFDVLYGCVRREKYASSSSQVVKPEKPAKDPYALSAPVKDMIGQAATAALVEAVAKKPHEALAMVAAMLSLTTATYGAAKPSRIEVKRADHNYSTMKASTSFEKAFANFAKLKPAALNKEIASLVAKTADLREHWFQHEYVEDSRRQKLRLAVLSDFDADPTPHFDPQAFFNSCNKAIVEHAMKEMTGAGCTATKKGDMAKEAALKAKETGWLPAELRWKGYKGPSRKVDRKAAA